MSLDVRRPSQKPGWQHAFTTAPSRRTRIILVAVAIVVLTTIIGLLVTSKSSPSNSNTKASGQGTCVYAEPSLLTKAGHTVPNIAANEAATACVGQPVVAMLLDAASYYRLGIREFKNSEVDIFSVNNQGVMSNDGDANGFIGWAQARGASVTKSTDSAGDYLTVRF